MQVDFTEMFVGSACTHPSYNDENIFFKISLYVTKSDTNLSQLPVSEGVVS